MCACYTAPIMTLENNLKTVGFWLRLGVLNHSIALAVIALGCAYSDFSCQGEPMKDALSLYAFTIFTPQLALEVIIFMAVFLVSSSLQQFRQNWRPLGLFVGTLSLLILFAYWR
jgi:hypothetical protein